MLIKMNENTQTYTYLELNPKVFNIKEEHKTIPMLEFENTWQFRLKTVQKFNELLDSKEIVRGRGFYPRIKDTRQAGIRVWKELLRIHFKDTDEMYWDRAFLEVCLKRKKMPQVFFNSICFFDFDQKIDEVVNASNFELKFLHWTSETPQPPAQKKVGVVDSENKLESIVSVIRDSELTHDEIVALNILLMSLLKS
jgi:hypothetical protein